MSRNSKEIKVQKQLKNMTDTLTKKIKEVCDDLDKSTYALVASIWNEVEKEYGEKPYNYKWKNTLH